jgi:hypothetical protein
MPGELKNLTVGSDLSILDIFLSTGGNPVDATYVGFELFDAVGVSAVSGVATNPAIGTYKASGVVPAGFQLGNWHIDWNIITGGGDFQSATELFCVQAVDVKIGFDPAGDKTSEIYEAVRLDIGDPEGQVFDDQYMQRILKKSVRRLNHRLGLSPTDRPAGIPGGFGGPRIKVNPIIADYNAGTITPNNDEICDLVVMMMQYVIVSSEISALKRLSATSTSGPHVNSVSSASQDGISVKNADGVSITISGGRLANRAQLHRDDLKDKKEQLEAAIKAFLNRMTGNFSKLIY